MNVLDGRVSNYPPRWNGAPSQELLVIRRNHQTGQVSLDPLRWGLIPWRAKDAKIGPRCINAMAETVASKPAFRDPFKRGQRCIVPVDGFYEWQKRESGNQPYAIIGADGEPLALAGLWERWKELGPHWLETGRRSITSHRRAEPATVRGRLR